MTRLVQHRSPRNRAGRAEMPELSSVDIAGAAGARYVRDVSTVRWMLVVIGLAMMVAAAPAAAGRPEHGQLVGIFTITCGRCGHSSCEDAMSGVVRLTSR